MCPPGSQALLQAEGIASILERASSPTLVTSSGGHSEIRARLGAIRDKWKPFIAADIGQSSVWAFDGENTLRYLPKDDGAFHPSLSS